MSSRWENELKMVVWMAASVCWMFVNSVFLLQYRALFVLKRAHELQGYIHTFIASSVELLSILVKVAVTFVHTVKYQRRGKCASALVRVCLLRLRKPLAGIFLSNVHSLDNKLRMNFSYCSEKDASQMWLCGSITNSELLLEDFQLFRVVCHTEPSSKIKGGGICFSTNSGWCHNVTVILQP